MNKNIKIIKDTEGGLKRGFTLVELLVVVALLGVSLGVTSDILISLVRSYSKTQVKNELEQQANFVGLKMEKEIRNANMVTSTTTETNQIVITKKDGSIVCYRINATTPVLQVNYGDTCNEPWINVTHYSPSATLGAVKVQCPTGTCFTVTTTSPQVVSMNMSIIPSVTPTSATFTGDIPIRNSITVRNYNSQ